MASEKGIGIVVMGVSGAGKSTIGGMLAQVMNGRFIDADDYHPQSNKDKMKNGIPLSEEDRIPWLETLRDALRVSLGKGETVVLGCSALQKHYREILRCGDPDYIPGSNVCFIKFILLSVGAEVLSARLEKRAAEGKHFMPPKLLQSQLDLLQMDDESEVILKVDASLDPNCDTRISHCSLANTYFVFYVCYIIYMLFICYLYYLWVYICIYMCFVVFGIYIHIYVLVFGVIEVAGSLLVLDHHYFYFLDRRDKRCIVVC